jgi:hypothetical protein
LRSVGDDVLSDRAYLRECALLGFPTRLRSAYWMHLTGAAAVARSHPRRFAALVAECDHQSPQFTHSIRQVQ